MEQLPLGKWLAMAVFQVAVVVGITWAAGVTFYEAKALGLAMFGLLLAIIAFNTVGGFIFKLPFSDETKATIALIVGLGALAILQPSAPTRPSYTQALQIARDEADRLTYVEVAGSGACTNDCSGHEAGFAWARGNGVAEVWDCPATGNRSFLEGCEEYAGVIYMSMNVQHWDTGPEVDESSD